MNKNNQQVAVIFGVTGQDGSYLSELLLSKSYEVIGITRRVSTTNTQRLDNLNNPNFKLIEGDMCDPSSVNHVIAHYAPDECYCLAAQSHVGTSFTQPYYTFDVNARGPLLILEAIRVHSPGTKFYQASTSEMFGDNYSESWNFKYDDAGQTIKIIEKYQDENTPLSPNSPYAVAKVAAHNLVRVYRDAYGIHASAGILFNHESERRGEKFVTRKITKYIGDLVRWKKNIVNADLGKINEYPKLKLGNIDAVRDWGHARDYVEAMWLMMQQDKPDDYIIGTGEGHSVRDFLYEAFSLVGLNWQDFVEIDRNLYRPNEVPYLRCKWNKAHEKLGWTPKVTFKELVKLMLEADIELAKLSRP